jgi:multiple sugar transport system substrate-binding protein
MPEDKTRAGEGRLGRRDFLTLGASSSLALWLAACGGGKSKSSTAATTGTKTTNGGQVTLHNLFQQQAGYSADDLAGMTSAFEQAHPNIKVNNTLVAYEALHDKIVSAAPAGTYDVVLGDCIWPAEFGSKGVVRDISDLVSALPTKEIFPGAIQMAQYKGKYYGMPWILDTKYMFANEKLIKKAGVTEDDVKTLPDLVTALKAIKSKSGVKYPWMGSWSQAEAVVCDYAQFLGAYGGKFLDDSGKPLFNQDGGVQALTFMKSLLDQGLADPASTSSLEADVLKAFAQGRIAMNLNWTFQLAGAKDPKQSKVANDGVLILHTPSATSGGPAPGCNGGQPVMITSGSKHVDEAWEYIKFITSASVQDGYAKDSLPIWSASYSDPKVIDQGGKQLVDVAKTQLVDMILRPQVTNYNSASQALQVQIQKALLGKTDPQAALNTAAKAFTSQVPG